MEISSKRIKNLEFRKATYWGEEPRHPSYSIDYWEPNVYYGNESKYTKEGDYYKCKDPELSYFKIHKSCFKHKEVCYTIASFIWDREEGFYELHFVSDRPFSLTDSERALFWELITYGNMSLNNYSDD